MSYLILIVSMFYAMFAVFNALGRILEFSGKAYHGNACNITFKHALRYGTISFSLLLLAIYINHWPKR